MNNNPAKEEVHFTAWMLTKFCILFVIISAFVGYNFDNPLAGLVLATAITGLSVAHSRIFDAASNSFLDIQEDDDATDKRNKLAVTVAKRVLYTVLDYGLAALSIGLVVLAKQIGLSYHLAIAAMWLLIDIPSAASLVYIYETTGRDMTLGRSYRRMVNTIYEHSKTSGRIMFAYEMTLASFWSGPDFAILFFRDELMTKARLIVGVIIITLIHAVLWTTVYWYGYENMIELGKHLVDLIKYWAKA
jgi:hypothetical protein